MDIFGEPTQDLKKAYSSPLSRIRSKHQYCAIVHANLLVVFLLVSP
jgi:hypothetical protein